MLEDSKSRQILVEEHCGPVPRSSPIGVCLMCHLRPATLLHCTVLQTLSSSLGQIIVNIVVIIVNIVVIVFTPQMIISVMTSGCRGSKCLRAAKAKK